MKTATINKQHEVILDGKKIATVKQLQSRQWTMMGCENQDWRKVFKNQIRWNLKYVTKRELLRAINFDLNDTQH